MTTKIFTITTTTSMTDGLEIPAVGDALSGFVVGPENFVLGQVAARFREQIRAGDSADDIPLVLYGNHALGKTYFAQLLAEFWKQERPQEPVLCFTAPDFMREFSNSDKTKDIAAVRRKWDSAGLCIIDDIQHLGGRQSAQRELSRLCEVRRALGRPLVVTAAQLPARVERLADGLRSRLGAGLSVEFRPMSEATCLFLLPRIAAALGISLTQPQIEQLSVSLRGGSVPQLISCVQQFRDPSTVSLPTNVLEPIDTSRAARFLLQFTAECFGVRMKDLVGKSRRRTLAIPRCIAMLLIRRIIGCGYQAIGSTFGNRDHTTVMHSCKRGDEILRTDPDMMHLIEQIESRFLRHLDEHHCSLPARKT